MRVESEFAFALLRSVIGYKTHVPKPIRTVKPQTMVMILMILERVV